MGVSIQIAERLALGLDVRLGTPVSQVAYDDEVVVTARNWQLATGNWQQLTARHVVVAIPPTLAGLRPRHAFDVGDPPMSSRTCAQISSWWVSRNFQSSVSSSWLRPGRQWYESCTCRFQVVAETPAERCKRETVAYKTAWKTPGPKPALDANPVMRHHHRYPTSAAAATKATVRDCRRRPQFRRHHTRALSPL